MTIRPLVHPMIACLTREALCGVFMLGGRGGLGRPGLKAFRLRSVGSGGAPLLLQEEGSLGGGLARSPLALPRPLGRPPGAVLRAEEGLPVPLGVRGVQRHLQGVRPHRRGAAAARRRPAAVAVVPRGARRLGLRDGEVGEAQLEGVLPRRAPDGRRRAQPLVLVYVPVAEVLVLGPLAGRLELSYWVLVLTRTLRCPAVALDLLRKTQGRRRGGSRKRRRGPSGSRKRLEKTLRGAMRTASRRASNVEVPSFLRQLVKETEKMVTFFFKGDPRQREAGEDEYEEDGDDMPSPYLDHPVLEKQVAEGGSCDRGMSYAVASMQGWRAQMEDAHTCMTQLKGELAQWSYFAVFDGHAGITVAQYCSRNLLDHILATGALRAKEDPDEVKEGIGNGFLAIDSHMHQLTRQDNWERSGSTAAAVLISPRHFYFINCGDSRTLLCRGGEVVFYTEDHKPCNPREKERIQNAGGSVTLQRVNGSLAVSRALGDFDFKEVEWRPQTEQLVSPEPEVYEMERSGGEDEFVILACDGVWDAIGNEELCAFVRSRLQVCDDLREICSQVLDLCLYKGSLDNMSIIIVCFPGAPQVSQKALQEEAELEQLIDLKVGEIIGLIRSKDEDPDLLYIIKFLTAENIPGLPPGGGIISKRDCIISAYQKYIMAGKSQEPMDVVLEESEEDSSSS
ncbi:Protein phosphatase 1A [Merluccius polli]|uniref:Protein phosphatase 1B n=1 Tax=Merluccius polli TaxID=89951 RepID=A0AA47MYA3_MERPO|nr:Protein phosphatase 1A [Merluccius polli]